MCAPRSAWGGGVSEFRSLLSEALSAELERLVDERVEAALAARPEHDGSPWLTLAEAADRLRVSERTIARKVRAGRIRTSCVGRRKLPATRRRENR